jgi:hypothetical protein
LHARGSTAVIPYTFFRNAKPYTHASSNDDTNAT